MEFWRLNTKTLNMKFLIKLIWSLQTADNQCIFLIDNKQRWFRSFIFPRFGSRINFALFCQIWNQVLTNWKLFLNCVSDRAKTFWAREDADQLFTGVFEHLHHLKSVLKNNTATDKRWSLFIWCVVLVKMMRVLLKYSCVVCQSEYVQGLKLLEVLDTCPLAAPPDTSVVQVVIGSGKHRLLFWNLSAVPSTEQM